MIWIGYGGLIIYALIILAILIMEIRNPSDPFRRRPFDPRDL